MVDKDFETVYRIRAEDEATMIFKGIGAEWERMAAEAKVATDQMNGATSRHGQEMNKLTQFYREQRSEHRLHSFLFREGRDAIGAAALALTGFNAASGEGSQEMKKLNSALQSGFVTFQGLDFALAGLGAGPWGLAIAGIAGLAAAFAAFNTEADKAADEGIKKFLDSVNQLANIDYSRALVNAQKAVRDAEEQMAANRTYMSTREGIVSRTTDPALEKTLERQKERAQSFVNILQEQIDKQKLWNEITEFGNNLIGDRHVGLLAEIDAQQEIRRKTLLQLTDESEILALSKKIKEVDEYRASLLGKQADAIKEMHEKGKELDLVFIDNEQKKRMEDAFKFFEFLQQSQGTRQAAVKEQMDAWLQQQLQGTGVEALKPRHVPPPISAHQSAELSKMEKEWQQFEITQESMNSFMVRNFDSSIDQMVNAMFDGTAAMDEAFANLGKSVLKEISAMIVKMLLFKAISGLLSFGTGTVIPIDTGGGTMGSYDRANMDIGPTPSLARLGGGGPSMNVNLTVNAMDARSVREWLGKTDTRSAIVASFRDAWDKEKA